MSRKPLFFWFFRSPILKRDFSEFMKKLTIAFLLTAAFLCLVSTEIKAGDTEFTGQLSPNLIANTEDFEQVVFKPIQSAQLKGTVDFSGFGALTAGKLFHPQLAKASILTVLAEKKDEKPLLYVDLNGDNQFSDNEKFTLEKEKPDNPYIWQANVIIPIKENFFSTLAISVRYFFTYKTDQMKDNERLMMQTTEVFANGTVDLKGKKFLTGFGFDFENKKISPQKGWQGIDSNEDGRVDMNLLSFEAANASDETVIFRVGQMYVSFKKVDIQKNLIVMREHEAKDYKRIELSMGKEFPDFNFVDFNGKKRKFSEFRGKYVLLDVWGFWCPPCRREMPYLREAARKFKTRNLEVVGLNTDPLPVEQVKANLEANQMMWTQAKFESVFDFINQNLRIESFPTTILIAPDGKILSMSRSDRDEPDLRGKDLLETLDEILPE